MKFLKRLPLYLGVFVFIVSVLVVSNRAAQNGTLTNTRSQASTHKAKLNLIFTSPDIVTMTLATDVSVSRADISLKYDPKTLDIIGSSVTGNASTDVSITKDDKTGGLVSFIIFPKNQDFTTGILSTFKIVKLHPNTKDAKIEFVTAGGETAVVDSGTKENILNEVNSLTI